jgi:hypothetical protein
MQWLPAPHQNHKTKKKPREKQNICNAALRLGSAIGVAMSASAADAAAAAAAAADLADPALPSVEKPATARKRAKDAAGARQKAFQTWARGKKAAKALCCHRVSGVDGQPPILEDDRRIAEAAEKMFRDTEVYEDAARRRREWALLHKCVVCHPPCDADAKKAAAKQRTRKRARADSPVGGHGATLPETPLRGGGILDYPDTIGASVVNADIVHAFMDDFSIVTGGEQCARDHDGTCVNDVPPPSFEEQWRALTCELARFVGDSAGHVALLVALACARVWDGSADGVVWWCDNGFRKAMDVWHMWLTQRHAAAVALTLAGVVDAAGIPDAPEDADDAQIATLLRLIGPFGAEHAPAHAASLFSTFKTVTQQVSLPLQRLVVAMTTECVCGKTYPHVSEVCVLRGSAGEIDI